MASIIPCANDQDVGFLMVSQKAYCQHILASGRSYLLSNKMDKLGDEEGYLLSISKVLLRDRGAISIVSNRDLNIKPNPLSYKTLRSVPYHSGVGLCEANGQFGLVFSDLLEFMDLVAPTAYFQSLPDDVDFPSVDAGECLVLPLRALLQPSPSPLAVVARSRLQSFYPVHASVIDSMAAVVQGREPRVPSAGKTTVATEGSTPPPPASPPALAPAPRASAKPRLHTQVASLRAVHAVPLAATAVASPAISELTDSHAESPAPASSAYEDPALQNLLSVYLASPNSTTFNRIWTLLLAYRWSYFYGKLEIVYVQPAMVGRLKEVRMGVDAFSGERGLVDHLCERLGLAARDPSSGRSRGSAPAPGAPGKASLHPIYTFAYSSSDGEGPARPARVAVPRTGRASRPPALPLPRSVVGETHLARINKRLWTSRAAAAVQAQAQVKAGQLATAMDKLKPVIAPTAAASLKPISSDEEEEATEEDEEEEEEEEEEGNPGPSPSSSSVFEGMDASPASDYFHASPLPRAARQRLAADLFGAQGQASRAPGHAQAPAAVPYRRVKRGCSDSEIDAAPPARRRRDEHPVASSSASVASAASAVLSCASSVPLHTPALPSYASETLESFVHKAIKLIEDDGYHNRALPFPVPGREAESVYLFTHVMAALRRGRGKVIYVSGYPGCGKSQSVLVTLQFINRLFNQHHAPAPPHPAKQTQGQTRQAQSQTLQIQAAPSSSSSAAPMVAEAGVGALYAYDNLHGKFFIVHVNAHRLANLRHLLEYIDKICGISPPGLRGSPDERAEFVFAQLMACEAVAMDLPLTDLEVAHHACLATNLHTRETQLPTVAPQAQAVWANLQRDERPPHIAGGAPRPRAVVVNQKSVPLPTVAQPMVVLVVDELDSMQRGLFNKLVQLAKGRVVVVGSGNVVDSILPEVVVKEVKRVRREDRDAGGEDADSAMDDAVGPELADDDADVPTVDQPTVCVVYSPYTVQGLCTILQSRTGDLFAPSAQQLLCRKVKERQRGDVRRLLAWSVQALRCALRAPRAADPATVAGLVTAAHVLQTDLPTLEHHQRTAVMALTSSLLLLTVALVREGGMDRAFSSLQAYSMFKAYLAKCGLGAENVSTVNTSLANLQDYGVVKRVNPHAPASKALFRVDVNPELLLAAPGLGETHKKDVRDHLAQRQRMQQLELEARLEQAPGGGQ